jgi:hypothetical protein
MRGEESCSKTRKGTALEVDNGRFSRKAPPETVRVNASQLTLKAEQEQQTPTFVFEHLRIKDSAFAESLLCTSPSFARWPA